MPLTRRRPGKPTTRWKGATADHHDATGPVVRACRALVAVACPVFLGGYSAGSSTPTGASAVPGSATLIVTTFTGDRQMTDSETISHLTMQFREVSGTAAATIAAMAFTLDD